jgi:hypothetical protein
MYAWVNADQPTPHNTCMKIHNTTLIDQKKAITTKEQQCGMRMTMSVCYRNHWSNHISHNEHIILLRVEGYLYPRVNANHKPTARATCGNISQHMQETDNEKPKNTNDR